MDKNEWTIAAIIVLAIGALVSSIGLLGAEARITEMEKWRASVEANGVCGD